MANYVKFMRGTPKAYRLLQSKDENTLYFIAEVDSNSGHLYLGDKEIICSNNGADGASYLRDLLDVSLPESIGDLRDGQVLTYDVATETWQAKDPTAVAAVLFDNKQFELNDNGELSIANFANAESGAQLTKSADGSLIWVLPDPSTSEGLAETVETLRTDVDNLTKKFEDYDTSDEVDTKISAAMAGANHLSYKIVNSTDEINVAAEDAHLFIYLVKNGNTYEEYMVVNGALERVGDWNVDLSNYATKSDLTAVQTSVADLTASLNALDTTVQDLSGELNAVKTLANTNKDNITALQTALQNKVDVNVYNTKMSLIDTDITEMKSAMTWNVLPETEE